MNIRDTLLELGIDEEAIEGMVVIDGLDSAVVGFSENDDSNLYLIYNYDKIIEIFMERDGMTQEEAVEFIEFNFYFPKEQRPVIMHRIGE